MSDGKSRVAVMLEKNSYLKELSVILAEVPMGDILSHHYPTEEVGKDEVVLGKLGADLQLAYLAKAMLGEKLCRKSQELQEEISKAVRLTGLEHSKEKIEGLSAAASDIMRQQQMCHSLLLHSLGAEHRNARAKHLAVRKDWQVVAVKQCDCGSSHEHANVTILVVSGDSKKEGE